MLEYRIEQPATLCFSVVANSQEEALEKARQALDYLSIDGFDLARGPDDWAPLPNEEPRFTEAGFHDIIGTESPGLRCYLDENAESLQVVDEYESEEASASE